MEPNQTNQQSSTNANPKFQEEFKNFYKADFKIILSTLFKEPIVGSLNLFKSPSEKAYLHSIIMYISVFVLYIIGFYLIIGEMRSYIKLSSIIKASLAPTILMLIITAISFLIKSMSGKSDFKSEMLTGALCGIPIALFLVLLFGIKIFASVDNVMQLLTNFKKIGVIGFLLIFYIIIMLINILQQSLKSSGTKDNLAFYLSPVSILLAIYVSYEIVDALF